MTGFSPTAMLTFANPVFLWALAGLAAPVLIHLIQRDLFRPVRFPSVRFITRGKMPTQRKRRPTDLWLLFLRMALFAAVVLALAGPEWRTVSAAEGTDEPASGELVLLLDVSASMGGWEAMETASGRAEEVLGEFSGQPAGLVVSGAGPERVIPLSRDHGPIRRALAALEAAPVAGDHRESLRRAAGLFSGDVPKTLAVVSDFQETDWSPSILPPLDPDLKIRWIPVGLGAGAPTDNAAILHARPVPGQEDRPRVFAEIAHFGKDPVERRVVFRAGDVEASQAVQLAAGETTTVSLELPRPAGSRGVVELVGNDAYAGDDRWFVWLGQPPPVRVLAVTSLERNPATAEDLFFISRALDARGTAEERRYALTTAEAANLPEPPLLSTHAAVLVIGSAAELGNEAWSSLREYMEQGGQVLMTPGSAPARQFSLLRDHGWFGGSFEGVAPPPGPRRLPPTVDWINPASPLADVFRDEAARGLFHVSLNQFVRATPTEAASVLLRTSGNDPVLLEKPFGEGRLLLSLVPFQTGWTDLPLSPAFLPLIRELIAGRLPPGHGILHLETGFAEADLPEAIRGAGAPDPRTPGIHLAGETPVVINVPRSESTPATADTVDLQAAVRPSAVRTTAGSADAEESPTLLWPWLALAAILFFLAETPAAALAGSSRRAKPSPVNRSPGDMSGEAST